MPQVVRAGAVSVHSGRIDARVRAAAGSQLLERLDDVGLPAKLAHSPLDELPAAQARRRAYTSPGLPCGGYACRYAASTEASIPAGQRRRIDSPQDQLNS